jgi:hypothetical protein
MGSKLHHAAVDTLGHLLTLHLTRPTSKTGRRWRGSLPRCRTPTGQSVKLAYVDRGYTSAVPAAEVEARGMSLDVVKHPGARRGFVLLPSRWVVERSFA